EPVHPGGSLSPAPAFRRFLGEARTTARRWCGPRRLCQVCGMALVAPSFAAPHPSKQALIAWSSISFNVALTSMLAVLTNKEDTPYFILMVVAVLEAAFRFKLLAIIGVVAVVDFSLFLQVWWFYDKHPPVDVGEYYEAGITSLLFFIVGVLVWLLLA